MLLDVLVLVCECERVCDGCRLLFDLSKEAIMNETVLEARRATSLKVGE